MNPDEIRRLECLRIAAEVLKNGQTAIEVVDVATLFERYVVNGPTQASE